MALTLDEAGLREIGARLASALRPGDVIALSGELGAGKTTLARAILEGLGHGGEVPSPSFTLVQTYPDLEPPVAHADLYRLGSAAEAEPLGLDDWLLDGALLLEWPERLGRAIWPERLWLRLEGAGRADRRLTWDAPAAWEGRWPAPDLLFPVAVHLVNLLGDLALMLLWIAGGVLLAFGTCGLMRRLLPPRHGTDGHQYPAAVRDMVSTTGLRIAALFGILLALVYAQELRRYQDVRDGLSEEAAAIEQVYFDAGRLREPAAPIIRGALADYVTLLVTIEWPALGKQHKLSRETWDAFNVAQDQAQSLDAIDARETAIRQSMIERLSRVAELRNLREQVVAESAPWLFSLPAIVGLLLVTAPFFIYPPGREVWAMLGAYGAFAGLILFFIHGFASPFNHPLKLAPAPFERMLAAGFGKDAALTSISETDA